MSTINFFGRAGELYRLTRQKDRLFFTWSLVGFGVTVICFIVLLSINIWLGQQLKSTLLGQTQTKQTLVDNQPLEVAYLVFSQKLKAIAQVFEQRNNKQQAINYLADLFGNRVFISGVAYDGTAQVLSLNLTSASIFDLEALLNRLDSPEVKANFSSLSKSNIRRKDTGSYDLKLTLELKPMQATPSGAAASGATTSRLKPTINNDEISP